MSQSLFLTECNLRPAVLLKIRLQHMYFTVKFMNILRALSLTEHSGQLLQAPVLSSAYLLHSVSVSPFSPPTVPSPVYLLHSVAVSPFSPPTVSSPVYLLHSVPVLPFSPLDLTVRQDLTLLIVDFWKGP